VLDIGRCYGAAPLRRPQRRRSHEKAPALSGHTMRLVPADPEWQPAADAAERALALFAPMVPRADHVGTRFEDDVTFYDAGQNTEIVECPACDANADDWWADAMDRAAEDPFADLSVVTPCCRTKTSLNDLRYVWPAAFGRFALEALNPGIPGLPDEQLEALETALGTPLRVVRQQL
jgi:hypothetical protein